MIPRNYDKVNGYSVKKNHPKGWQIDSLWLYMVFLL